MGAACDHFHDPAVVSSVKVQEHSQKGQQAHLPHEPRRQALLIGINYQGMPAELKGCHNDVGSMVQLLTRLYGFSMSQILVLLDNGRAPPPTRANILKSVSWLVEGAEKGDCLFFHFSGHGAQQEDVHGEEEDCMDETIVPVDFLQEGHITDDELFGLMCSPLPSGAKLTAVMDCCHSGTGLDLPYRYELDINSWVEVPEPCHSAGHVVLLSGCLDDQCSADTRPIYEAAHGAMSSAFCATLMSAPRPTHPGLLRGLREELARSGLPQRPQLTSSQPFNENTTFDVCGGAQANVNPLLGRHPSLMKRRRPKCKWLPEGDPLALMLGVGQAGSRPGSPQAAAGKAGAPSHFEEVVRVLVPVGWPAPQGPARSCGGWEDLMQCAGGR